MGMIATKNIHLSLVEIVPKIYLLNRSARLVEEWRGIKILAILFCKLHILFKLHGSLKCLWFFLF